MSRSSASRRWRPTRARRRSPNVSNVSNGPSRVDRFRLLAPPAPSGRAALGALRATGPVEVPDEPPTLPVAKSDNGARPAFDRDELTLVWADEILPKLKPFTKALYQAGRFVGTEGTTVMFALPTEPHRAKCEASRAEVESVLSAALRPAGHDSSDDRSRRNGGTARDDAALVFTSGTGHRCHR